MLDGRLTRAATPAADRVPAAAFAELDRRLVRDPRAAPLVVGLSGGSDSLALLRLVTEWARACGRPVAAVTVDHGLSLQARDWSRFAHAAAERAGASWRERAWEGPKPATGLPAAARRARHTLLAEAARELGSPVVLLGHTADDLAEGEAMRARDAPGLGRLRSWGPSPVWPEGRGVFLVRPLLRLSRPRLREWLVLEGEGGWVEDPANADPRFARARARAAGIGALCVGVPGVRPAAASPELRRLAVRAEVDAKGRIAVERSGLREARPEVAQAFVSVACTCAGGGERPPRGPAVASLRQDLCGEAAVKRTLAGAEVRADPRRVVFAREAGRGVGEGAEHVHPRMLAACGAFRREADLR